MVPGLAAAGVTGGVGVAQSALGYYQGLRGEQLQRDTNALNYKMWQEGLEYNKPVNQVARLKEAGLNPALMYGTGQGANVGGPAPQADAPKPRGYNMDPGIVVQVQQARVAGEQAALIAEQRRSLKHENDVLEGKKDAPTKKDGAISREVQKLLGGAEGAEARRMIRGAAVLPSRMIKTGLDNLGMIPKWMRSAQESAGQSYQGFRDYMRSTPLSYKGGKK